ncbi:MAG: GyrI-like domain-containing protein, partial [Firmicutes bacterium]|nr:GyrI-like domain-containing protein [Bacillota bacterium]
MDYQFEVSEPSAQSTLAIRTRTPAANLPQELGKAYGAIYQYLLEIGQKPTGAAYAAYYNMDMQDLDVEMGFIVEKPIEGRGEIKASEIPGDKQVSCMYKGPYNQMEPVYKAMMEWMAVNQYIPTGVAYELYFNDPSQVPESELLTKIV